MMAKVFKSWGTWVILLLSAVVLTIAIIDRNILAVIWIISGTYFSISSLTLGEENFEVRRENAKLSIELFHCKIESCKVEVENLKIQRKNIDLLTKECNRLMMRQKHFARLKKEQSK